MASLTHYLTNRLTHCCLVDLTDVTLAFEDANSKLLDVFSVADFEAVGCYVRISSRLCL